MDAADNQHGHQEQHRAEHKGQPAVQALHIQDGRVHVDLDFDRREPALYGTASLSLTASQLLWLGLRYGPRCLNIFLDVRKQEKAAQARQRKAA